MTEIFNPLEIRTLILPKAGSERSECEDSIGTRRSAMRFCIADGATEAFDSRRWARLLTKHWVRSERSLLTGEQLSPWLCALGERFRGHWAKKSLPWYAEEKARGGAFAAFLGVSFFKSADRLSWQAIAIGDSCLIHTRGGRVESSFPISDPAQFGYHPILAPSNAGGVEAAAEHVVIRGGRAEAGDVFLLLTDAIAACYLEALKTSSDLICDFNSLLTGSDEQMAESMVKRWRENGSLRNDDIAAIRISVGESALGAGMNQD
jgi:hypothetical protein